MHPFLSILLQTNADLGVQPSGADQFGYFLLLILVLGFYFLPAIAGRKKQNASSITLLNLFLGWTFIGWVVALVWATSNDSPPVRARSAAPRLSVAEELHKLQTLREMNVLTEEEFLTEKLRVLRQA